MNSKFITLSTLSMSVLPLANCYAADKNKQKEAERPNIVVIIADDLLSSEISCYGGQNLQTTNIDRIAREGVRFTQNYASEAMSVPIRASMYTGLYPMHHGAYQNHKATYDGTKTVNDYMPEEGYRVGRTGKNHPGPQSVYKFDEIPGFTVGCTDLKAPYNVNGVREFINRNDTPFLLYVCSIHPHAPWTWGDPSEFDRSKMVVPENCVDNPEMREVLAKYLAEVRALDNEVGSILDVLTETGKLDNTIVIFLGEQGPQFPGGKWTLWYPGVNSALVARYPAKIKPGTVCDAIVQYEDLLPTFLDIAGGKPRPELDGISFKKALFGETNKGRKYAYGIHNNIPEGTAYPIRSIRDDRYALIWNLTPQADYFIKFYMKPDAPAGAWEAWFKTRDTDPKAKFLMDRNVTRPEFEFYDLQNDKWELTNLIDKPEHQAKIKELKAELQKWMKEQGDTGANLDVPIKK